MISARVRNRASGKMNKSASRRASKRVRSPGRKALRVSADTSRELLAAVPDMMFRMSGDGHYLEFKPAKGLEPFVPPSEFLGRHMSEVLPENVAAPALHYIRQALRTRELQVFEYQLPLAGGLRDYEARIVALGEDEVLAVVRDISIGRPAEHQVAASVTRTRNPYGLTMREVAVLRLVTVGVTDKEIASQLHISPMTVRKHVGSVRRKMSAVSRTEASVRAVREGLLA